METILTITSMVLMAIASSLITILIEKAKIETPKIEYLRILSLDHSVPETLLEKLEEELRKDILLKNIKIFVDPVSYDDCLYDNFKEKDFLIKINSKKIENYEEKEKELECWKYNELIDELKEMTKNEKFAVLVLTTMPIYHSKKDVRWINAGYYCDIKIKKNIWEKKLRIGIIPYEEKIMKKEPELVIESSKHQLAHLLGISNYGFTC